MLIDFHANPGALSPDAFAAAVKASGIDAVVITCTNQAERLEEYLGAVKDAGVKAYAGVELAMDRGAVVFVPSRDTKKFRNADWAPEGENWTREAIFERLADEKGATLSEHPYFRDGVTPCADRIYWMSKLDAVVTRVGRGKLSWDTLADQAAEKMGLTRLGSAGSAEHIGAAATVLAEGLKTQGAVVKALRGGETLPVEMEDPADPRDRTPNEAPPSRDRDDRRGGGRGDRGGRGGRDRGGRGGRGERGGRGGRGGRKGGGRRDRD